MSEETDEKFIVSMQSFPALFDKSSKDHSNRDVVSNSWESISDLTGMSVDDAKACWTRLVREYRTEKTKREGESRSGSGATLKRETFPFYDIMKDMLMTSYATGPKFSNYVPQKVPIHQQQQQQQQQQQHPSFEERTGAYDYTRASGRSKKKEHDYKRKLEEINGTIELGNKVMTLRNNIGNSNPMAPNDIVGRIVQTELEAMGVEKSQKKRYKIQNLLNDEHARRLGESEE